MANEILTQQERIETLKNFIKFAHEELHTLGVHVLTGAQEEGQLRTDLSEMTLIIGDVGKILGSTGPASELPKRAQWLMDELRRFHA